MMAGMAGPEAARPDDVVRFAVADGIATITLDRPERRNALSIEAADRLYSLWERIDQEESVRVAILTSADCGTFCAGMDLKEAAEVRRERGIDVLQALRDPFYERMREVRKPIVAAMTGHFTAGGMMLCLNSDLRVGLAGTLGGITEARIGRGSPWSVPLVWMLPQAILMALTLTGDLMPIERFHELGFVNHVEATPDAVRERALALARRIRDNAPLSVAAGKEAILRAMDLGCRAGFAEAKRIYARVYASEDAQEGPRAFSEKRAPVWKGR
jgi:enoyl-CoA hydratase